MLFLQLSYAAPVWLVVLYLVLGLHPEIMFEMVSASIDLSLAY
jgi:Gpi18-like mannosyltransferase